MLGLTLLLLLLKGLISGGALKFEYYYQQL